MASYLGPVVYYAMMLVLLAKSDPYSDACHQHVHPFCNMKSGGEKTRCQRNVARILSDLCIAQILGNAETTEQKELQIDRHPCN